MGCLRSPVCARAAKLTLHPLATVLDSRSGPRTSKAESANLAATPGDQIIRKQKLVKPTHTQKDASHGRQGGFLRSQRSAAEASLPGWSPKNRRRCERNRNNLEHSI